MSAAAAAGEPAAGAKRRRSHEEDEGSGAAGEDTKAHGPLIKSTNRLAALTAEQLYSTFYVPVLRNLAKGEQIRQELARQAGCLPNDEEAWVAHRCREFVTASRRPNAECTATEMHVRSIETRVAIELCFRGNVDGGIQMLKQREPELAGATAIAEYSRYYEKSSRSFTVRPYRVHPPPAAKPPPPKRTRGDPNATGGAGGAAGGFGGGGGGGGGKSGGRKSAPKRPPVAECLAGVLPKLPPIAQWTPEDAAVFLEAVGFDNSARRCRLHGIGGEKLATANNQFIRDGLGLSRKNDRMRAASALALAGARST